MFELQVNASGKYGVYITRGMENFREKAVAKAIGKKVAIVTDSEVNKIYGDALLPFFNDKSVIKIVVPSGEDSKNGENYFKILNTLAENGFTREDSLVAFGGGMVGDLTAFAASTYMRGITVIAVPTTILSMVDSSVGGKTAINLRAGKNLCGTFYQPKAVYINADFINTLPKRELLSGYGEILKYALLERTINISSLTQKADEKLIYDCLKIKRDIVEKDEKENGIRAFLNLGHTVGHALEKLYEYKVSHGECVAKGLKFSVFASKELYSLKDETVEEMTKLLTSFDHDFSVDFTAKEIAEKTVSDKKCRGETINFVALKGIGKPSIEKLTLNQLFLLLEKYERNNYSV